MRYRKIAAVVRVMLVAWMLTGVGRGLSAQLPGSADSLFSYDAGAPLDVRDSVVRTFDDDVVLHDVTFGSPRGGRVHAYLVRPAGAGPFAGIVFGPWGPGDRTEFLSEALLYARLGVVSLLVDWPWVRPPPDRRATSPIEGPEIDREVYAQAVVDLRRAVDVLVARPDVDAGRIAYVGHSFGAQFGAALAAVDRRVSAAALLAGIPDIGAIFIEGDDPDIVEFLERWTPEQVERYMRVTAPLDAINFVGRVAPTPLLLQFAEFERSFGVGAMQRYAEAARDPKTVLWYPTGHELNDVRALFDRMEWIASQLRLESPRPLFLQLVNERTVPTAR